MSEQTQALIETLLTVCREAGEEILKVYREDFDVDHKPDQSPLTEADMASHRTIIKRLRQLTPELPILSEESSHIPYAERRGWERYWLVDPLDGTKEFVKRNDEFTVNIALIEGTAPVMGLVYVPVWGCCYYAARGQGAFRVDRNAAARPIRVSARSEVPIRVAASRSHPSAGLQAYLDRLGDHQLIPMGSSLKFCLIAEGKADLYVRLGKTSEWDTAAAQCVVTEAGGRVTDTNLQALQYNTKESLLNPEFLVFGDSNRDWSQYL